MSKSYFIPRAELKKSYWLKNFAVKLPNYITRYGLAASEGTDTQKGSDLFVWILDCKNLIDGSADKWTAFRDEMLDGIETGSLPSGVPIAATLPTMPPLVAPDIMGRATSIANRIKKHTAYTLADGRDLGLEGAEIDIDTMNIKPVISVRMKAGHPEIVWTKNKMSSIEIHVDRDGSGNYVFLAIDSYPNYTDNGPLPSGSNSAVWKYKVIYRLKDEQVGQWSDGVSVVVKSI